MEKSNKIILVTGATGNQGGAAINHLLKDGWKLRALTRDVTKPAAAELKNKGVEVVQGDLNDIPSIEKALEGVYGVFSVQNFWEHGYEGELTHGNNIVDCAKKAGVGHFVMASVGGAERNTGLPHFDVKAIIEKRLKVSGLNYTIIRPVFFMENFSSWFKPAEDAGKLIVTMAMKPERRLQMIAVDDIGFFVKLVFGNPEEYSGKEIELAGDELSMPDVAALYGKVFGKPAVFNELPVDVLRSNSKELADMFQWFNDKGYEAKIDELKKLHPDLMSFEQWLTSQNSK